MTLVDLREHENSKMKADGFPSLTVREADNAREAEQLLPRSVLGRLCSDSAMSEVRRRDLFLSRIIVALDGESPLGFAAYRPTAGPIRVAHEFWVDPDARCGLAPPTDAMLTALEAGAQVADCSRLFVVVARSTGLRRVFEQSGYRINLVAGELTWFEKDLVSDGSPLESA